ncbi:MAG: hypothetical protein DWQ31_10155 [Planctomycetota bacterium]|nr:MAG: hypothetical protein DWQ31_10155 [Planctomycetota bacterium]REJ94630.1 MAG: hypothetical protein DWQ35_07825 [Planctomycetota bacterium]REK22607.1 MAG: hypothetical protein DWQ42_16835 [Planctomycetota bacterium]REK46601.1 MAG: hypothetical protein DWQ46_06940 [Planctomycetota bacterium]
MIRATKTASPNGKSTTQADAHYQALVRRLERTFGGSDVNGGDGSQRNAVGAIGITSSRRGEGVSTVAANLALAAAEMSFGPVLLIDANLHHPSIARMFRLEDPGGAGGRGSRGFVDALGGDEIADLVEPTTVDNLSVMLLGGEGNALSLLNERLTIQRTIDELRTEYDWIIFDLPPATELSECFALSGQLDSVIMVVQADGPSRESVQRACRELEIAGANVLGAVLNKMK